MGKVLEMIHRACGRAVLAMTLCLGLLAGCGNGPKQASLLSVATQRIGAAVGQDKRATTTQSLSRADLEKYNSPIWQAEIPGIGASLYLVPFSTNGRVETWATSDDITLSFRDGILAATRGLGPDLMESATPPFSVIRSGAGTTVRQAAFLDGADHLVTYRYDCSLRRMGSALINVLGQQQSVQYLQEECVGVNTRFVNEYWLDSSGKLLKSKEFLAPGIGHAVITRLIDR